ncbi:MULTISPECIES: hypothetical protein [Clostridium]|jgi:hypothetical protein|uniref:DUF4064 domain-containing protein n=1 Tax=Clostridium tertium TaxID=1559 RepID=A0A9X3XI39_9CLOT|nr:MULTISPECIES: hypothetical protein [Clostridium]MBS5884128.1 hypothetical protein [Clostridium sp.]MBS6500463.1 hypothetical protein [Clostridium sp.]MBU6134594.1 hypothetical protein [Clostridium tertium]MDC4238751.1 hypothetical protein [Clostridium tertium]MDU7147984.1 hypothetical protein [Clostridium sp.]
MKVLNRKLERNMILIGSIWQLLSGLATIFIYATYIKTKGVGLGDISQVDITSIQLLLDNVYIVTTTIGFLFMAMGLVNLYIYKKTKNNVVEKGKGIWLIVCSLISYFFMDIISAILFMVSGVIMLSKNKAILKINNGLVN